MAESLLIKINGIVDNHTARRLYPVVETKPGKDDDDIVEYAWRKRAVSSGSDDEDAVIEEYVKEVSRVNRQAYIAIDADQVGVMNILEKVRRSNDFSLLNQTGADIPEDLQDYTKAPQSLGEALKALEKGASSFEGLKAIFGDISFADLANMNESQIAEKLQQYVDSKTPVKEGE